MYLRLALTTFVASLTACIPLPAGGISTVGLERLRRCESHGNYSAVSESGVFAGAYQFSQSTWNGVATRHWPFLIGHDPAGASIEEQDAMARWLFAERGRRPWPVCGRRV